MDHLPQPSPSHVQRLTSCDFTGRDKTAALREFYGRELMRVDLQPLEVTAHTAGLDFSTTMLPFGSGAIYAHTQNTPCRMWRSPEMLRDGSDDIYLFTTLRGNGILRTPHESYDVPCGSYGLVSKARVHEFITPRGGASACIQVPHAALARRVPGLEEAPLVLLPPSMPEPALALGYAQMLASSSSLSTSVLQSALLHLQDLMATMLAPAARGARPEPETLNVPRLALIQRDIRARITQPGLNLVQIARMHHLTPRQVQRLFAGEGTCFSDFVCQVRLERARAMLIDPAQRHRRVLAIALDNGFDGASAFSRAFRRHFGVSPSEVRGLNG
ncbi:helix-turn-helix transcriptional regulator [Diaphorobacter sp. HDW4A]|uniref:helix-turn-helix transcriptional regulator n=1 Tax=Diaphorobacter sp. HDW4A TaxID=2714924 RepID=UPI00140A0DD8|nr:helix-turn-helix transcriptional regulator [Diaphorobacter sp. HDW4A]QIL79569.1 helix-turn-helix transcriptional regulator [Diaphorobacter sp. HDW4A]